MELHVSSFCFNSFTELSNGFLCFETITFFLIATQILQVKMLYQPSQRRILFFSIATTAKIRKHLDFNFEVDFELVL
jgi:hypothetical protein